MDYPDRQTVFDDLTYCILIIKDQGQDLYTDTLLSLKWRERNRAVQQAMPLLSEEDTKWISERYSRWCKVNSIDSHDDKYSHPFTK